ncbi:FSD1 [Auxenochlorella protothecoides x Auxenochlorella symbiontica]
MSQKLVMTGRPLGLTTRPCQQRRAARMAPRAAHELPPLPFPIDSLESKGMSKETFEFHWGKHHRAYVTNMNNQIQGSDLEKLSLEELIHKSWNNGEPTPVFNNAAQTLNHTFFWESLSPNGGGEPSGKLAEAIKKEFGSLDKFKEEFGAAGATQFGSGWAWLVEAGGKLAIRKTPNAVNPIVNGEKPLLTLDVWEHAYYLDFQNRRPDFIKNFWNLVNWDKVAERYGA